MATGVLFFAVFLGGSWLYPRLDNRAAPLVVPDCFAASPAIAPMPTNRPLWEVKRDVLGKETLRRELEAGGPPALDALAAALAAAGDSCKPGDCPRDALAAYQVRLLNYLEDMTGKLARMQAGAGEEGRLYLLSRYQRPVDATIRRELVNRYNAGLVDPRDAQWEAVRAPLSILLFKGPLALRACSAPAQQAAKR